MFWVALLVAVCPFVLAISASFVGEALGCNVNEGGATPCFIWGVDIGELLAGLFVMGWLTFMSVTVAGPFILGGLVLYIVGRVRG